MLTPTPNPKPSRSRPSRHRRKPGPTPVSPSKDDRRRVEIGIGGGLSAAAVARLFGMSRRTFNRTFAVEIETGRARVMIEMGFCLYKTALDGNAAAAKALLAFMERSAKADAKAIPENNRWEGFAERFHGILPENEKIELDS